MKCWGLGTSHGLRRNICLNKFVFGYNRRFHGMFYSKRSSALAAHRRLQTYRELTECVIPRMPTAWDQALT
jgi:hypothetical protein